MEVNQKELRERLLRFIELEGVTQKFISEKTSMNTSILSRFKNGQIDLYRVDADLLDDYLHSKGY